LFSSNPVSTSRVEQLAEVSSLSDLRSWWLAGMRQVLRDDCAVVGEADHDSGVLRIRNILLRECDLHEDVADLIGKCSHLVATWGLMAQPCELDLGACDCVGARSEMTDRTLHRRFLIHAASRGSVLVFVLVSSVHWADTREQKRLLEAIAEPLARVCGRFAERKWSLADDDETTVPALTKREVQIICALREGMTNKEIARRLGISPNTVRNHISKLSAKVGARSRAQLALLVTARPPDRDLPIGD
jgi:DNA-binding CsgD family transcriptional regulator